MAKQCLILFLTSSLMASIVYAGDLSSNTTSEKVADRWCVVQASAPPDKLQGFLDYACGKVDCASINVGGACYDPNTLPCHASYALNQLYRVDNFCNTEIGLITNVDPSYPGCVYPPGFK